MKIIFNNFCLLGKLETIGGVKMDNVLINEESKESADDIKGLSLSPIVRMMKNECKVYANKVYNVSEEAKHFMRELTEEFIKGTMRELIDGNFMSNVKTITSEHIVQAFRTPHHITIMRIDKLIKCLNSTKERMK